MHNSSSRRLVVRKNHNWPLNQAVKDGQPGAAALGAMKGLAERFVVFLGLTPLGCRIVMHTSEMLLCLFFCLSCLSLYGCPRPKETDVKEDLTKYMDQARLWTAA